MIICDLDYTIVNVNTTYDFLCYFYPVRYKILSILLRPLVLITNIIKIDIYKKVLTILCLKGKIKINLEIIANNYINFLIKNKAINNELLHVINNYKGKKILLSASLEILVNCFLKMGFDYAISSKMYYQKDKFKNFSDLYGKKHILIEELSKKFKNIIVIDDSPESEFFLLQNGVTILSPEEAIIFIG